jgi:hypothetical protein
MLVQVLLYAQRVDVVVVVCRFAGEEFYVGCLIVDFCRLFEDSCFLVLVESLDEFVVGSICVWLFLFCGCAAGWILCGWCSYVV